MKNWLMALTVVAACAVHGWAQEGAVAAESPAADAPAAQTLSAEIKVGADVQDREIVGEASNFPEDADHVTGWSRITGAHQPTEISHVWKRNGEVVATVKLPVQSSSYRTYSRKTVSGLPGNWTLEVRDASDNVLGVKHFTVGAAASAAPAAETPAPAAPATGAQ